MAHAPSNSLKQHLTNRYHGFVIIFFGVFITGANAFAADPTLAIHGFLSQGYIKSDKNNFLADTEKGSFQINEMGINFHKKARENLNLGIQLFARDLGPTDNDAVAVDWAYADYHFRDYLGFRAGRIKNPVGLYHETRDVDMLRTAILLPEGVYTENIRDVVTATNGVSVYGDILTEDMGNLSYKVIMGTTNIRPDGGTALAAAGSYVAVSDTDIGTNAAGAFWWTDPSDRLKIGGTLGLVSRLDLEGKTAEAVPGEIMGLPVDIPAGIDTESRIRDILCWIVSAEFTSTILTAAMEYRRLDTAYQAYLHYPGLPAPVVQEEDTRGEGYYALVSHRFSGLFEAGYYYSVLYTDMTDRDGEERNDAPFRAWKKDQALSFRFDLDENWIFKLEGHYIDGCAAMHNRMNPDGFHRYWYLFISKLSYSF